MAKYVGNSRLQFFLGFELLRFWRMAGASSSVSCKACLAGTYLQSVGDIRLSTYSSFNFIQISYSWNPFRHQNISLMSMCCHRSIKSHYVLDVYCWHIFYKSRPAKRITLAQYLFVGSNIRFQIHSLVLSVGFAASEHLCDRLSVIHSSVSCIVPAPLPNINFFWFSRGFLWQPATFIQVVQVVVSAHMGHTQAVLVIYFFCILFLVLMDALPLDLPFILHL